MLIVFIFWLAGRDIFLFSKRPPNLNEIASQSIFIVISIIFEATLREMPSYESKNHEKRKENKKKKKEKKIRLMILSCKSVCLLFMVRYDEVCRVSLA